MLVLSEALSDMSFCTQFMYTFIHWKHIESAQFFMLIPVAARPKSWDCGRSLAGIANSRRGHGYLSVVSAVSYQVEVSATGRSLIQRNPTNRGVLM
jgi:hypothetical protein